MLAGCESWRSRALFVNREDQICCDVDKIEMPNLLHINFQHTSLPASESAPMFFTSHQVPCIKGCLRFRRQSSVSFITTILSTRFHLNLPLSLIQSYLNLELNLRVGIRVNSAEHLLACAWNNPTVCAVPNHAVALAGSW